MYIYILTQIIEECTMKTKVTPGNSDYIKTTSNRKTTFWGHSFFIIILFSKNELVKNVEEKKM